MSKMKLPYECLSDDIWLYKASTDNKARYALGKLKPKYKNPLVCIGINPSYAIPGFLDPTLRIVDEVAEKHKYDGWIMLNI